jgi:ATP-dependent RNA helicase SUPV3L1/SUV3
MLESKATQFTLSADGKILWQEKLNNPLPGIEVASLVKGEHPLKPGIVLVQTPAVASQDPLKLQDTLNLWLNQHFSMILEPLMLLGIQSENNNELAASEPVVQISKKIYDGLGIIPREDIEDLIEKLDPEKRAALRNKKIRLGPILVFIPSLNKPAAVKLRGLLWSLYHDRPLPAKVPSDGIVSQKIEVSEGLGEFYRSIGYPLYGGRAVRIDMLDRVISSIYDNAKDGVFEARHEMAEWLGTPIDDLYKILESMGHKKIEEPPVQFVEPSVLAEVESHAIAETSTEDKPVEEKKPDAQKPALAKFRLKRGKAFQKQASRPERKPYTKNADQKPKWEERKKSEQNKSEFKGKPKFDKESHKKNNKHKNRDKKEAQVVMLESKNREEDSPFAVLQKLIVKKDG